MDSNDQTPEQADISPTIPVQSFDPAVVADAVDLFEPLYRGVSADLTKRDHP